MMMKKILISSFLTICFLLNSSQSYGQTPSQSPSSQNPPLEPQAWPAPAHSPAAEPLVKSPPRKSAPAPPNVTDILEKAGGFSVFSHLLHNTDVINQIENQLNSSNSLTILAPTNGGFSSLKGDALNSLTPEQKVQLLQFHIIPNFVSLQNFETLTNPVRTQASNTEDYPLNVTAEGGAVNVSTGVVNTMLSGTVYTDGKLAIYRLESVLLPIAIFAPRAESPTPSPAPSPAPARAPLVPLAKPKKGASSSTAATKNTAPAPSKSTALKPATKNSTAAIAPVAVLNESGGVSAYGVAPVGFSVAITLLGQFL